LYDDVEADIAWARVALEQEPDAINLWIGNSRSVTALHRDNYENVYCQITGSKHFVLLPPIAMPCVNERMLKPATYIVRCVCALRDFSNVFEQRKMNQDHQSGVDSSEGLIIAPDTDAEPVPSAVWDPDKPTENSTPFSKLTKPMHVDLDPGDMLYLPALW
jgi:peptidyl-lysine (3S)-dioxygenase / protease